MRLLVSFLFILGLSACGEERLFFNLDNQEFQTMLEQGVPVVDIRRPEEWKQTGIVKGSQKMTFVDQGGRLLADFLPKFTATFAKDAPVILICRTGNRTRALATHLSKEMGYTQVYQVKNGITSWIREGYPVTRE